MTVCRQLVVGSRQWVQAYFHPQGRRPSAMAIYRENSRQWAVDSRQWVQAYFHPQGRRPSAMSIYRETAVALA